MFVLIKVNKRCVQQVLDHSSSCSHLSRGESCGQHFTPHIEYDIPKFGNRFKLLLRQKQCNCSVVSDNSFEIYNDSSGQHNITADDQQLSQTMSDVLTFKEDITETVNDSNDEFIWVQILSSIKGIQINSNKSLNNF